MTDPLRSEQDAAAAGLSGRERDARIEELLVVGLDYYFSEQYELAINVWTRVLFLDRGHARARAYIERARSAAAERQRKGDELLHTGVAAFDRGDAGAARALLASALEHGAAGDEALAVLARIERLEAATAPAWGPPAPPARTGVTREVPVPPARTRLKWIAAGLLAGTVLGAAVLGTLARRGVISWPPGSGTDRRAASTLASPLPVPTISEIALTRAQTLYARGRVYEALAALDQIAYGDAVRPRADELKAAIQKQLLAGRFP